MFRKKWLVLLFSALLVFLVSQVAFANYYDLGDYGDIIGTTITIDGTDYFRPGLVDTDPLPLQRQCRGRSLP